MLKNPFSRRANSAAPEAVPQVLLEFQSPTAAIIATPLPVMGRAINWCISATVLSTLAATAFIPVDMIVSAHGDLSAAAPDTMVQAFSGDAVTTIVRSIDVRPGALVHKGQLLATLDPTYARADLTSLTAAGAE
jgi:hemolysin D